MRPFPSYAEEKPPGRWAIKTESLAQTAGAYPESIRIPGFKIQLSDSKRIQLSTEHYTPIIKTAAFSKHWHDAINLAQMQDASSSQAIRLQRTLNLGVGLNL